MKYTRRQRTILASCYWSPCPTCGANVPLVKAVGVAAAGFDALHMVDCRKVKR